ncbi:MAG: HAMP domain-containing sensor histidine kinase, partial [Vicinamibacteria bacterium]
HETLFFRLSGSFAGDTRVATDGTLIAQHALILFAALIAFAVAGLARESNSGETAPALRAYEEAMLRLRARDDERVAVFEREKLKMTEVLRDREAMARAGELTAGIVHEVRNSLGVISTQSGFVARSTDHRAIVAAAAISEEVRVLQGAMNRFLDFIRFERVDDRPFELSRFVNRIAAREGENHSTEIKVEGLSMLVRGDEDLLERAIENIVRNARQAAGETGAVTISFGADQTHAFVIVEDNGPGIKDVEKALRPFESARPGGLGLGLPLVLKILSLHNGTLDFGRPSTGTGTQAVCRWPKAGLS